MKHLVIFSGAGMSAESGLKTFRDNGGLWENYKVEEVATPEAWAKDPEMVLHFYNLRRSQLFKAKPNQAHYSIADLEKSFKVSIITQNIDDLHERAGSSNVVHLHGELKKVRSEKYPDLIYECKKEKVLLGETCEKGYQLRPHVVWFGEEVPQMEIAFQVAQTADILVVVGTSLNVYPAANVVNFVPQSCKKYLIDPNPPFVGSEQSFTVVKAGAEEGMRILSKKMTP